MATSQSIVDHLVAQMSGAGTIRSRKMFGEYAVYCDDKVVALVCDNRLFVKPTAEGKAFATRAEEAPPYPGSKPFLVIEEDLWDDQAWITELIRRTAAALPALKKKIPKQKKH